MIWSHQLSELELRQLLAVDAGLPSCIRQLHSNQKCILSELDQWIVKILMLSKAIDLDLIPPVKLKSVAKFVNCDFLLHRDDKGAKRKNNYLGALFRTPEKRWKIVAGDPALISTRVTVAHELGHLFLYKFDEKNEDTVWENRQWSIQEECVVNYIARKILIPDQCINWNIINSGNLAKTIVTELQANFKVDQEIACLRMLDLANARGLPVEVVFVWRQYHPFDRRFLVNVLREALSGGIHYRFFSKWLQTNEIRLKIFRETIEWNDALKIWTKCFAKTNPLEADFGKKYANEIKFALSFVDLLRKVPEDAIRRIAYRLSGSDLGTTFFPAMGFWQQRPQALNRYVPVARGTAKRGSQAYRLAHGVSNGLSAGESKRADLGEEISVEFFAMGGFKGFFKTHGFGHGNEMAGRRFVVQVLVRSNFLV